MRTAKNVKEWLPMSVASTLTCTGCVLVALSVALDTFSTRTTRTTNHHTLTTRGPLSQCDKAYDTRNRFISKNCSQWSRETTSAEFMLIHHDVMLALTCACVALGGVSLLFSVTASCSRAPRYVTVVTGFEMASGWCGVVSVIVYGAKYLGSPWQPGESYFVLIGGAVVLVCSSVVHWWCGDVKFYGKVCCAVPASTPDYRYQRTEDAVVEL